MSTAVDYEFVANTALPVAANSVLSVYQYWMLRKASQIVEQSAPVNAMIDWEAATPEEKGRLYAEKQHIVDQVSYKASNNRRELVAGRNLKLIGKALGAGLLGLTGIYATGLDQIINVPEISQVTENIAWFQLACISTRSIVAYLAHVDLTDLPKRIYDKR